MRAPDLFRRALPAVFFFCAACALAVSGAIAAPACRIAFDLGSSGIRAGASNSTATTRAEIDFISPQLTGKGIEATEAATVAALRDLPTQAGFPPACERIGGGFSAWRMALAHDPEALADLLARIRMASGVPVLVLPQGREGAYAYLGARQILGSALHTSHVLDIGGGSLQIAGADSAFGAPLGQKLWHRLLCARLRNDNPAPCPLQPLGEDELTAARQLIAEKLHDLAMTLPASLTLTAISRPVSRGVLPAVRRLAPGGADATGFDRSALTVAIRALADKPLAQAATMVGAPPKYATYLLSDMLLVEGILAAADVSRLQVAEAALSNLPGLLADDRVFAWGRHYDCYLGRLRTLGEAAYQGDPERCE